MNKKEILDILDNAKDEKGSVPMRLVRQAFDKLPTIQPVATDTNVGDKISRQAAIDAVNTALFPKINTAKDAEKALRELPPAQPEIIRCHQCGFWDRETLRHQHNDFRDWNEAECMMLAERDGYNEISHYVEADDYCSYAERRTDGSD